MRDSIILAAVVLSLAASVHLFRQRDSQISSFAKTSLSARKNQKTGGKHVNRETRVGDADDSVGDSSGARKSAKSKKLHTIYQGEDSSVVAQTGEEAQETNDEVSNSDTGNIEPPTEKVLYGVPLDQWVRSRRQALLLPGVTPEGDMGLRVLLWCMELKKARLEYVGQKECQTYFKDPSELARSR